MRDLNAQVAEWRSRMAAGGIKSPAVLDELESHLREEIQLRMAAGISQAEAFEIAAVRVGSPGSLRTEFNKISGRTTPPVIVGVGLWTVATILITVLLSGEFIGGKLDFLLFIHTVTLTTSYTAAFLCGGLGIVFVFWRSRGGLSLAREESLNRAAFRFAYVSGGLAIAGFLSGMLWGRQHFGTFWIGSPREIGCLCACAWMAGLCLVQWFGRISNQVRMLLYIIGNMIVGLAWFCAVVPVRVPVGITYYWPIEVFLGVHFLSLFLKSPRRFETAQS